MGLSRWGAWATLCGMPGAAWVLWQTTQTQMGMVGPTWRVEEGITLIAAAVGTALATYLSLLGAACVIGAVVAPQSWEKWLGPWTPRTWRRLTATALGLSLSSGLALPAWAVEGDDGSSPLVAWIPHVSTIEQATPPITTAGADQSASASIAWASEDPSPSVPSSGAADTGPQEQAPHTVAPGDSLWTITRNALGPQATHAEIARTWPALYQANKEILGDDPGLIFPGQVLTLPEELS